MRQNWEQHLRSFVVNRQHPMLEGAWWCLRALKRSPLWLEWSAERMVYKDAGKVDENQKIEELVGRI